MSLINKFTTDSGLELDLYYSFASYDVSGHLALDGYISKELRDEGKSPLNRVTYSHKFDKKDLSIWAIYEWVKKQPEFINSQDA